MGSILDLFTGGNFKRTIQQFAKENEWTISEIDSDSAALEFEMESGREQTIYINRNEDSVDFNVPSMWSFESEDELPHELSTALMERNGEITIGKWSIRISEDDEYLYCCEYSVDLRVMDPEFFRTVVEALINECDEMEGEWEEDEEE